MTFFSLTKNQIELKETLNSFLLQQLDCLPEKYHVEIHKLLVLNSEQKRRAFQRSLRKSLFHLSRELKDDNPLASAHYRTIRTHARNLRDLAYRFEVHRQAERALENLLRDLDTSNIEVRYDNIQTILTTLEKKKFLLSTSSLAVLVGKATKRCREVNDQLSGKCGRVMHVYCGCHIQDSHKKTSLTSREQTSNQFDLPSELVENSHLKYKAISVVTADRGHLTMSQSAGDWLAKRGAHIYVNEYLSSILDLGPAPSLSSRVLSNLAQIIRIVIDKGFRTPARFLFATFEPFVMKPLTQTIQYHQALNLEIAQPDALWQTILVSLHSTASSLTAYTTKTLDRPFMSRCASLPPYLAFSCDFDYQNASENFYRGAPQYENFRLLAWCQNDSLIKTLTATKKHAGSFRRFGTVELFKPDQIIEVGFTARKEMYREFQDEELAKLRQKWGVDADSTVIVILSGSTGVKNAFSRILADTYKNAAPAMKKIHVFSICGNNQREWRRQMRKVPRKLSRATFTPLGWTVAADLAELFAMAKQKDSAGCEGLLISPKAGGLTSSEAGVLDIQFLTKHPDLQTWGEWERVNAEQYCNYYGLGKTFKNPKDFVAKVLKMISEPRRTTHCPIERRSSEEKSVQVLQELFDESTLR